MGLNITDATCWYGLAQTEDGCVRTLAAYNPDAYLRSQIIYCALGAVSVIASGFMYWRAVKYDGSALQNYCFIFCAYASVTLIVRAADPSSYGHIIPRPIAGWLADSCTAALYSVYILALGYWALIIQQGAAVVDKPARLQCLESSAIAFVWAFYTAYDASLFAFKGFQPLWMVYMQLVMSACILGAISTTFLIYGLRVLSRLQAYERQAKLRLSTAMYERMLPNESFNLALSSDDGGVPIVPEPTFARRQPKEGHATKIKKILFVAEAVSLIVMAGQLYMAVVRASSTPVELSCANGSLCDTVKSSVSLLHLFQCVCVWVLLWTFRGMQKKSVIPRPIV
ncbi:hypothetical protein F441_12375 [Phytophthora nicotianae CJ01A1]|uniref:THH1/TOM1/TOM3 domain-containing protein n=2 Tax=Phytophthora nicotianae TaxID=4792 RepID=W2GHJ5_PHYNI|nr:hypothetical protein L915_12111 [Phytophthora nicotianae]ETL35887.1 hypothetical protein L916_12036 [Phytophthora nicotianae]ETP12219.1 hypothetical protein F441_12375 [Phytophthora nicotianae CJ01A1]